MNIEAQGYFTKATEFIEKVRLENIEIDKLKSELNHQKLNLRSIKAKNDSFYKTKGMPMAMIKNATEGEETCSQFILECEETERKIKAKEAIIEWLKTKIDMCKKNMNQIHAETPRMAQ